MESIGAEKYRLIVLFSNVAVLRLLLGESSEVS